ncbi:MAG: HAMP domain-containing sensor histidine kinase [bacterium]
MEETHFAPAERSRPEELERQKKAIVANTSLIKILDAVPEAVLILNKQRQVVYFNDSARNIFNTNEIITPLGLRVGEVISCAHSRETAGGCGTTESCAFCGAVNAILLSQRGQSVVEEARISLQNGDSLDLKLKASPYFEGDEVYTVFSLTDISDEKRKEVLERTFFHDILNTASGLSGYSELLLEASGAEIDEYKEIIHRLSRSIIDEINAQKLLIDAEKNELTTTPVQVNSLEMLRRVINFYGKHQASFQKSMVIDENAESVDFNIDDALLARVLSNMLKNALEASDTRATVRVSCRKSGDRVEFSVNNQNAIPREIALQIFKRSFSTKGKGRGIGTYSMKMMSEKYLGGRVHFESNDASGTTFIASYPLEPVFK